MQCKHQECNGEVYAKGVCRKHYQREWSLKNKRYKNLNNSMTRKEIGRYLDLKLNTGEKTIGKSQREMISYKHKELKVGQVYTIKGSDIAGCKSKGRIKGKVIAEYPNYYLIDTGKYKECINKYVTKDLEIKESER